MPTRHELVAYGKTDEEVCREMTADALVYQDLDALKQSVTDVNPAIRNFEASCFDGNYITGDVTPAYLDRLETERGNRSPVVEDIVSSQLHLSLSHSE
jgi:amidophosphoribosyltransferase